MALPFLAVPVVLGGAAAIAGAVGIKKGYDAKCDFDDAEYYNNEAKRIYDDAQSDLNSSREQTNSQMEILGGLKVSIYRETLADFVDIFSKIKNVDFEDNLDLSLSISDEDYKNVLEIKKDVLKITELVGGTTAAVGSGALAGFGAFGGAGMLATASTGTAIGSLSGVAATNATLAWFGGGSLAAGGLGMAGGMAVLGGIVAGPVIAVAGGMMAAKAETAKYEAEANLDKAKGYVEEMETAKVVVEEINTRVTEFINILNPLNNEFENYIDSLEDIVDNSDDYSTYSEEDKKVVMVTVSIAQTVKNICDVPIIDENGEITRKSKRALKTAKKFVSKLEEV
jgi:hypothetical protein